MALNPALRGLTDEMNSRFVFAGLALVLSLMLAVQFQSFESVQRGENINVDLMIHKLSENESSQVAMKNNTTAFDALNSTYSVEYRKSSMGYFITGIDGLSSNDTHYWVYTVNQESPQVGAGKYLLDEGDQVSFRYVSLNRSDEYIN